MADQKPVTIPIEGGGDFGGGGVIGALKAFHSELSQVKERAAEAAEAVDQMAERSTRSMRQVREEAAAMSESFSTLSMGIAIKGVDTGIKDPRDPSGKNSYKGMKTGGLDMGSVTEQLNTTRGRR